MKRAALISVSLTGFLLLSCLTLGAKPQATKPAATKATAINKVVNTDLIRVGLTNDAMTSWEYPSATLSATGKYTLTQASNGQIIATIPANHLVRVTKTGQGFELAHENTIYGPINGVIAVQVIDPIKARLRLPSVTRRAIIPSYRGVFELTPSETSPSNFTVINVLPMQDYLKAVVPNELPISFGYEAVRAQAVAARNYAIRPREKPWKGFDICDSQYCQAYYGSNTEHPDTSRALEETEGLVALYHGEPILALYSSSHGGVAERYENVFSDEKTNRFPGTPIPYLDGGPDSPSLKLDLSTDEGARQFYSTSPESYDKPSGLYRWQRYWDRAHLEGILSRTLAAVSDDPITRAFISPAFPLGQKLGTFQSLTIDRRGVSGKAMQITLTSSGGSWTIKKEYVIRKVLENNGKMLPSANFVVDTVKDKKGNILSIRLTGGGFGHGVGMSQYGASSQAKQGKNFVNILQHYYHGVSLGSRPLSPKPGETLTGHFFAYGNSGRLCHRGSVQVKLNQKPVSLASETCQDIKDKLLANRLNTLEVKASGGGSPSVWVEVVEVKRIDPQPTPSP